MSGLGAGKEIVSWMGCGWKGEGGEDVAAYLPRCVGEKMAGWKSSSTGEVFV